MPQKRPTPALRATVLAIAAAAIAFAVVLIGALTHIRGDVTTAQTSVSDASAALQAPPPSERTRQIRDYVSRVGMPVRVVDAEGAVIAQSGGESSWSTAAAPSAARLATIAADVTQFEGAVEATRSFDTGTVVVREPLDTAAQTISRGTWLTAVIVSVVVGILAFVVSLLAYRRRSRQVAALTAAAEGLVSGRIPEGATVPEKSDLARAAGAITLGAQKIGHLSEVADRELGLLSAAIEPLSVPVLGRGPAGGRLRNLALDRLMDEVTPSDRRAIDQALSESLDASEPVGSRVALSDGRQLEVDAWTVPGGRLVAVSERTEQARLEAFRRQLEGSAARQLRAPIDEIKSRGEDLYQHIPAPSAPALRGILAATDRLDHVVRMMLRGTRQDTDMRPPRREVFGVAGFLWGLAHDWDAALRQRALRVELDIPNDLPDIQTDSALVQEILTELIDNAAKFTRRGGTIRLGVVVEGRTLALDVRDSGPGLRAEDALHATERFFRGESSEAIPGAGLGLGVAAALAERLGGRIDVQPGPGGHVRLTLPLDDSVRAAA